jgi:outer membrane receptor protein involved in Fe transport
MRTQLTVLLLSATSLTAVTPAVAQVSESAAIDDEIVVTGSRIARDEFSAPAPIQQIDSTEIARSGEVDIATLLREVPALNNTLTANDSANTAAPNGVGLLNLRGLGSNRTLGLVNGRRHVAGVAGTAAIDTATIPIALIERVEVLTGGASSIYGADAVTGVVNFILKDDFEGFDYRLQGGISDEGDAEEIFAAITTGGNFGQNDRGNAVLSVEYTHSEPLFGFDRDFATNAGFANEIQTTPELVEQLGLPAGTLNTFAGNVRFPFSSRAGAVDFIGDDGFLTDTFFVEPNGTVRLYDFGQSTGSPFESIGGDGVELLESEELIRPDFDRFNLNANVRYEFAPELRFFAETKFVFTNTIDSLGVNGFNDFIPLQRDNPFIPADLQTTYAGLPSDATLVVSRDTLDDNARGFTESDRYTGRAVIGFDGEFDNGWTWEASYNYGRTDSTSVIGNSRVEDRFFASIDAVALTQDDLDALGDTFAATALRNGEAVSIDLSNAQVGDILCRTELQAELGVDVDDPGAPSFPSTNTTPRTFTPGDDSCVPTSILGANAINGAAADFAFLDLSQRSQLTQEVFLAVLAGDSEQFFELPGGPIGFAVGFEYREEGSTFTPAEFEAAGFLFGGADEATQPVTGSFDVREWFGEVSVPVISGVPLIENLTVDGAVRFADYSTIGEATTWSTGVSWAVTDQLRLRGTYGQAIRAPNIDELFSPRQPDFSIGANADPCDPANITEGTEFRAANCEALVGAGFQSTLTARVVSSVGGNLDLNEETATTFTVGAVYEPLFLEGLALAVDYYDIEIEDAIDVIAPLTVLQNCVDAETINNEFCAAVDRDPVTGNVATVRSGQENVAALEARGIDISARYDLPLADVGLDGYGDLRFNVTANRNLERTDFPFQEFPDQSFDLLGESGLPKWIVNADTNWDVGNFNLNWQVRWQSEQLLVGVTNLRLEGNDLQVFPNTADDVFVHDVQIAYDLDKFGGEHTVYAGINNLTDEEPFLGELVRPAGVVGRFFFVGLRGNF